MEISDEYQDMGNPGGGGTMANIPLGDHHQTSESPVSHQEEDLSDPDLQDEESGEELLQQPHGANTHTSTDNSQNGPGTPTPLTHLNTLMNPHQAQLLAKFKMEQSEMDMLNNKSSLEALQAAMSSGGFNLPFSFPPPAAFLPPQHHNSHPQIIGGGMGGGIGGGGVGGVGTGSNNAIASSASSLSSESSQGSSRNVSDARECTGQSQNSNGNNSQQQSTSWSFEEQFKQVRQLYEINDDPKRKEFLDDLFSFMQKRGTPINRLPIMAKAVLDLYELYNLVIARGGLVDVINKKLWQEIIKGLHLPSSITSAAFTLRTQYMKYLYSYECEKQRLSTEAELRAAIDGNRREGRRSSYGAYVGPPGSNETMIQRNPHTPSSLALHTQMSPLSLVTTVGGQHHIPPSMMNGSGAHTPLTHHPHLSSHGQGLLGHLQNTASGPAMTPAEFDSRMVEYVKLISKELRNSGGGSGGGGGGCGSPTPMINRQGGTTSPSATPPRETALNPLEFSRMTLWNMYNNNTLYSTVGQQPSLSPQLSHSPHRQPSSPEPQREALDLGLRSSPMSSSPARHSPPVSSGNLHIKKDHDNTESYGPPASKRSLYDDDVNNANDKVVPAFAGTHIKISSRGDSKNGDNSLVVSMELNGVMYQGVLFAQGDNKSRANATTNNNSKTRSVLL